MSDGRAVFLHGINMETYGGYEENLHAGGFEFVLKNGFGHEIFNFTNIDGRCYGYVEMTAIDDRPKAINLTNLGASKSATSVDGVLAVWTAPRRGKEGREIVGWYRNATLHKNLIKPTGSVKQKRKYRHPITGEHLILGYRIEARVEDCFLLRPEQRILIIPAYPNGTKGVPGQSAIYYPFRHTSKEAKRLRRDVLDFVNDDNTRPSKPSRPRKGHARGRQDQARKKAIEIAAVAYVRACFGQDGNGLGFRIESREAEDVGYDVLMTKGDLTLCAEVKGRSRDDVVAEFSSNESRTVRKVQDGRFREGEYRVCIVTDALNERGKRTLHVFSWWKEENDL